MITNNNIIRYCIFRLIGSHRKIRSLILSRLDGAIIDCNRASAGGGRGGALGPRVQPGTQKPSNAHAPSRRQSCFETADETVSGSLVSVNISSTLCQNCSGNASAGLIVEQLAVDCCPLPLHQTFRQVRFSCGEVHLCVNNKSIDNYFLTQFLCIDYHFIRLTFT